jgi:hypothetical protein
MLNRIISSVIHSKRERMDELTVKGDFPMKRRDFCTAAGVTLAAFTLPAAGQEDAAAVQIDLYELLDDGGFTETVVGWIVANTTAAGLLIVEVHLDQGDPLTWFDVDVIVNGEMHEEDMAWLTTNDQGVGNTHVVAQLNEYPEDLGDPDRVTVQVLVSWAVEDEE